MEDKMQENMEEIREPIEYKFERLVDPEPVTKKGRGRPRRVTRASMAEEENEIVQGILNLDIESAMKQSIEEMILNEKNQREEQQKQEDFIRERRIEILSKFKNIRHQMKRIASFDKDIQELNMILVPIIDQYCENLEQSILVDEEIYDMILKNIRTIRLKKEEYDLISLIIKY
jgi:hypothetical protein